MVWSKKFVFAAASMSTFVLRMHESPILDAAPSEMSKMSSRSVSQTSWPGSSSALSTGIGTRPCMPSLGSGYNAGKLQTASYDIEDDVARALGCLCPAGSVQSSFSSSSPARPRKAVAFEGVPVILVCQRAQAAQENFCSPLQCLASHLYYLPAGTCVRQLCLTYLAVM